ncbi:hypothetical protein [Actinoplanes sp. NPDC049118]|uniref:hypothetical protein n=1 Tax=Actinoplanes sp. NPDC049118 TaxID=3155769 RepID=UPI0033E2A1F3
MRLTTIPKVLLAGALALTTVGAVAAPAAAAPARQPTASAAEGTMTSGVQGTFTDAVGGIGQVTGTFDPTEFAVQDDTLVAVGTLHAVLTDSTGAPVGTADETVTLPVQLPGSGDVSALAPCNILHLVLGPLDLDLLGLKIHLNTVVLDITAHSGPGNLLGNLLCAIVGLLDGGLPFPLAQLADLLNQVLAILAL